MDHATRLARWVLASTPYRREAMTHLKLQKLAFYCWGAALAFDRDDEVGRDIGFEAWEHGPVCRPVWLQYRAHGAGPIERLAPSEAPQWSAQTHAVLLDALRIYGALSAWSLRQESHLEAPWKNAFAQAPHHIDNEALRAHFRGRFLAEEVHLPAHLSQSGSARLDGIPTRGFASFHALADAVEAAVASVA